MRARSSCPCCGHSLSSAIKKVPGALSGNSSFRDIQATWIGVGKSNHFDYYKCISCGTLSTVIYPDESSLAELYKSMPPNMDEAVDESDQYRNQFSYASCIAKILREESHANLDQVSFLELGADRGLLAKAVSRVIAKKLSKAFAVEPNQGVLTTLSSTLKSYSRISGVYRNLDELLSDQSNRLTKYDVIAAIHVLDHAYDPFSILQALDHVLSENGIIYLVVHNPKSFIARLLGYNWPAYCAQHPQLFTPLGIHNIATKLGYKVLRQGRTINHFSLAMLADFLGVKIPNAKRVKLFAPLGNRYYCLQRLPSQ